MKNENVVMPRMHGVVRDVLCAEHKGAIHAICQADLAAKVGLRRRMVRKIIKDLIEQFGQPIGSMYTRVGGYFWIATIGEAEVTCKIMTDHAVSQLSRVATLKKIALPDLLGQISLGL